MVVLDCISALYQEFIKHNVIYSMKMLIDLFRKYIVITQCDISTLTEHCVTMLQHVTRFLFENSKYPMW